MLIARSFWWKALVWATAAGAFILLAGVTMFDSRYVSLPLTLIEPGFDPTAPPAAGARLAFTATAYCKGSITSSGVAAQTGVTAADPSLLPIGTIVQLDFREDRYDGIYTVMDTGAAVQGREIDLYMWRCEDAQRFGRRPVRMTIIRLGWNPHATTRGFFDRFKKQEPVEPEPIPSRPLQVTPGAMPAPQQPLPPAQPTTP